MNQTSSNTNEKPFRGLGLVVAIAANNAIGKDNQLLWHLPADLKHFKNITTGHTIIMGRKTYDSIGRPLPNRRNIVITRQANLKLEGVEVVNSLQEALSLSEQDEQVFVIGGAQIYKDAMALVNQIHLTTVHASFEADAFFPEIDPNVWMETEKTIHEKDEKNAFSYTFSTLVKR